MFDRVQLFSSQSANILTCKKIMKGMSQKAEIDWFFAPFDLALNSASNGIVNFHLKLIPDLDQFCCAT